MQIKQENNFADFSTFKLIYFYLFLNKKKKKKKENYTCRFNAHLTAVQGVETSVCVRVLPLRHHMPWKCIKYLHKFFKIKN